MQSLRTNHYRRELYNVLCEVLISYEVSKKIRLFIRSFGLSVGPYNHPGFDNLLTYPALQPLCGLGLPQECPKPFAVSRLRLISAGLDNNV